MSLWQTISNQISVVSGEVFKLKTQQNVGGGCINSAHRLQGEGGRRYFVKLNSANLLDMFEAEAEGLEELAKAAALKVPEPVCTGIADNQAYIVMEALHLDGSGSMAEFARQLAQLHRYSTERFGWKRDNTIGSTLQINTWEADWVEFWREHRLGFQLDLAAGHGAGRNLLKQGEQLMACFDALFSDYQPEASLLHGDLWSGNYAFSQKGEAVIFDPAVYFGDREADLAMTELFGGFSAVFYDAYDEAWPIDVGYKVRKTFYNLYHILNHFNMFGGGYGAQAEGMIGRLLSELR